MRADRAAGRNIKTVVLQSRPEEVDEGKAAAWDEARIHRFVDVLLLRPGVPRVLRR
jgi:hypothetical protein